MNKAVLGIDLGTSSVKAILKYKDGKSIKEKQTYDEITPKGFLEAIKKVIKKFDMDDISSIGLSSQVGTYITDKGDIIIWNEGKGKEELQYIKSIYSKEIYLKEISMVHPDIISYPLPRLIYIKNKYKGVKKVYQPKDYICECLTGNFVTDKYSWRGLSNLNTGKYSEKLLKELNLDCFELPELIDFCSIAGVTKNCDFLPDGIPVYVGLNDYYSSLLGMSIKKTGDMFDITGTSEHVGIIESDIRTDTAMVSGPYIYNNVHYGVTASSGVSLDFGMSLSEDIDVEKSLKKNPPIFLPYLNGERAPVWDSDAKGVFWGITGNTDKNDMAYSVFEGVVFSLYHIYENMGSIKGRGITVSGGASKSKVLNRLKAEMLDVSVVTLEENDTSALGACIVAAYGEKWYESVEKTIEEFCKVKEIIKPEGNLRETLKKRYEIYKSIYPAIKDIGRN